MKKERRVINLDRINHFLQKTALKTDARLLFELEFAIFVAIQVININFALHHFAFYNFNYLLLTFNLCFLSRRLIRMI